MLVAMHSAQKGMTVEGKPTCVFAGNKQKVPSVGSPEELSTLGQPPNINLFSQ